LTDVNDQTPTFRSEKYEIEIAENSQQNTPATFLGNSRNEVFDYDLVILCFCQVEKIKNYYWDS
jgi:hypothetical protein